MATSTGEGQRLRARLDEAVSKGNARDTLAALQALSRVEPEEARWPQRLGDTLRKAGRNAEAEAAWVRAVQLLQKQGYLARAIAVARQLIELNPARADLLASIDQESTRALRTKALQSPAFRPPPVPKLPLRPPPPPVVPPPVASAPIPKNLLRSLMSSPPPPMPAPAGPPPSPRAAHAPSFVGGIPLGGLAALAKPLERAPDAGGDEVRFDDVPSEESVAIEIGDFDFVSLSSLCHVDDAESSHGLRSERVVQLSATSLFADVSAAAVAALAGASNVMTLLDGEWVCRRGVEAHALYVVVEGTAVMLVSPERDDGVELGEGQAFGEGALLRGGVYPADVRARGPLMLLWIGTAQLRSIAEEHTDVHHALFDLLGRRLLTHTLQMSPLFAAFDTEQKRELARMFEVRRAAPGIVLEERGKRCDGLYITLAGEFEIVQGDESYPLTPGSIVGHEALLSRMPARRSVMVMSDSIVLRMPAAKFGAFAAQFPPALAYLADAASSFMGA